MGEQRNRAAGPGDEVARTALLPDLTDVDLRTLRAMDDPELSYAVARVLRSPHELTEAWYSTGDDPLLAGDGPERMFPVGSVERVPGEESRK
ncbi:hypothetical protein [Streptomyces sp. NPDC001508]|uniref:hypothetical protein n=1 Tax=Streptomyces sp. NPDC001508 TaxID=3154656 RepID=UPI003329AFF0